MSPIMYLASGVQSTSDYLFFRIIYRYLTDRIHEFGLEVMARTMAFAGGVALVLMTIWLLFQGYRIATGQMRGSMTEFIFNSTRAVVIVSTATSMALFGTSLHTFLTIDLNELVTYWLTGHAAGAAELIDRNLALMQLAATSIDALQVVDDAGLDGAKTRAMLMSGMGIAGPSAAAATMLLLFHIGMAMFIGFGPLFILALLFDSTKSLFQRWLMYGIGTLFSMAALSFVTALALKVVGAVAISFWTSKITNGLIGSSMGEGLSNQAVQQGGIGLLMTALIISTPPMAAMFFQGTLGNLMSHSGFQGVGHGGPGALSSGTGAGGSAQVAAPDVRSGDDSAANDRNAGGGGVAAERSGQLERAMAGHSSGTQWQDYQPSAPPYPDLEGDSGKQDYQPSAPPYPDPEGDTGKQDYQPSAPPYPDPEGDTGKSEAASYVAPAMEPKAADSPPSYAEPSYADATSTSAPQGGAETPRHTAEAKAQGVAGASAPVASPNSAAGTAPSSADAKMASRPAAAPAPPQTPSPSPGQAHPAPPAGGMPVGNRDAARSSKPQAQPPSKDVR